VSPPRRSGQRSGATNKRWLLKQISLFANLTEEQLDFIVGRCRLVEFERDEFIYKAGDPPDALYGVVSGRIRVYVEPSPDKRETLDVLHRGDYFGMVSILTDEPHSVSAQVINDAILFRIQRPDFEAILKEIPEVAIHLSTTLSRRLHRKELMVKKVFESTLISLYSPVHQSGQTMYGINLASSLVRETGKSVILVDVSPMGDSVCRQLGVTHCPPTIRLKEVSFDQSRVDSAIVHHPSVGIDTLNVAHDPKATTDATQVTPLLSYLANLYHYVITDLPHEMDRTVFKALAQTDIIHLVSPSNRRSLQATAQVVAELKRTVQQAETRVKVIVNESSKEIQPDKHVPILGHKVYATLPVATGVPAPGHPIVLAHPDWQYARAVRRIAREIGEMLLGLVLGSGAALGLAHIGVLRVLEQKGISIDVISGASIGALIGVFWASGQSPEDLEQIANGFRSKTSLFKLIDLTIPKMGFFTGRRVTKLLTQVLGDKTFMDLKIPVRVVACDYTRRKIVTLAEGSVVQAVRASVSIPAIFEPIRIDGRYLIDGGVLDPVPVDVLTQMGVHKVIAVNALPSPANIQERQEKLAEEMEQLYREAIAQGWLKTLGFKLRKAWWDFREPNIFDVLMHTMQAMEYELAEAACAQADVVLHPTIPRVNWWEFYNVDQLIRRGEEETEEHLDEIIKLAAE